MRKFIKSFFKAFGTILGMDFAAWLFAFLIDQLILGWTPLSDFKNEELRVMVKFGICTVIFLLILFVKPLIDQIHIEADSEEELKKIYVSNARSMCLAYLVYLFCYFFTIFALVPFWGASAYFYAYLSPTYFIWLLLPAAVFCAIVILMNVILFYDARRNLREKEAEFYAGKPSAGEVDIAAEQVDF